MPERFKTIIIILSVLFLASCIPGRELRFDYLVPAEYTLSEDSDTALVLNSAYLPGVDTSKFNVLRKLDDEEQYIIDTLIMNNIFDGFFYIADDSPLPSLRNSIYAEIRGEDTTSFLQPLSQESINLLLDEFSADVIISLEYYGMNYDYSRDFEEFGNIIAILIIDRALLWRIYSREGMLKEKSMRDTLSWEGYGITTDDATSSLPNLTVAIREAFWFAGEEFAMEFSPSWRTTERSYFIFDERGEDRSMDPAYLRELSSDHNRYRAYKANFNLSIYHEKNGDLIKAIEYMNAALDLRPGSALANFYKKKQLEKLEQFQKLQKQME
ncbi:MAG: DUF6340 family protein [Bacteroidales bacterium]